MPLHLSPFALIAEQRPISDRPPPVLQLGNPLVILLSPRPQRPSEAGEVLTPRKAVLFAPAGVVPADALLPELACLIEVLLTRATYYHGVEFPFDHLAACCVHLSPLL